MINSTNTHIELKTISSIYKIKTCKDKETNELYTKEEFKKEVILKRWFSKDSISSYSEVLTNKDQPAKTRCVVFDKYSAREYTVKHSLSEIHDSLNGKYKIGYK